jgi:hypothetical protein
MDEIYRVNFERELACEFANNIANRLLSHTIKQGIALDVDNDPCVMLLHDLWDLADRDLYVMTTVEEVRGVMIHLKRMAKVVDGSVAKETRSQFEGEETIWPSKTTPKSTSKTPSQLRSSVLRDTSAPAAAVR